jgi:hypothetical protein
VTETSALVDFKAAGWVEASAWPAIIRCYRTVLGVTCADMPHRHPVQPGVFLLELRVSR